MSDPTFYTDGNTPRRSATRLIVLNKILGAILDGGGGGGGGGTAQIIQYTTGVSPAAPANPLLPAFAYDSTGVGAILGWNVAGGTWTDVGAGALSTSITVPGPPAYVPPYISAIVVDSNGRVWVYSGGIWN